MGRVEAQSAWGGVIGGVEKGSRGGGGGGGGWVLPLRLSFGEESGGEVGDDCLHGGVVKHQGTYNIQTTIREILKKLNIVRFF